jgi:hypothetical protein
MPWSDVKKPRPRYALWRVLNWLNVKPPETVKLPFDRQPDEPIHCGVTDVPSSNANAP